MSEFSANLDMNIINLLDDFSCILLMNFRLQSWKACAQAFRVCSSSICGKAKQSIYYQHFWWLGEEQGWDTGGRGWPSNVRGYVFT